MSNRFGPRSRSKSRARHWHPLRALSAMIAVAALTVLAACSGGGGGVFLRSDPPLGGMAVKLQYKISQLGSGIDNSIQMQGIDRLSPMQISDTSYSEDTSDASETDMLTAANGGPIQALAMDRRKIDQGVTKSLIASITTYEQRDAQGNVACGAKVRLTWQPNVFQMLFNDKNSTDYDALFYYQIPCAPVGNQPEATLDLSGARFIGLVVDQQFTPRVVFGAPIAFNRGHSVTIVGGMPAQLIGGWWDTNPGLKNAANLVESMVHTLDANQWLSLGGQFNGAGLVYSAGDADVYLSLRRIFLDQQTDYMVNFRSDPNQPWRRVDVHPVYNNPWNNLPGDWFSLTNTKFPKLSDLVDTTTGQPKSTDPTDENYQQLRQIETAGCQNCGNATLSQVQFIDPSTRQPLWAVTIRGWLGSQSSLALFGGLPGSESNVARQAAASGSNAGAECPIQRDSHGKELPADQQISATDCAGLLQEGSLWDYLVSNASALHAKVVAQFQVRDNSLYKQDCDSSDPPNCSYSVSEPRFNASYLFSTDGPELVKAWTILQLLGEVGMRTLGFSYAAGPYEGSGLDYAMAQMVVPAAYWGGVSKNYNPENVFALDARALQLPGTLGAAAGYLFGPN
jgi:hypothetical protein